MFLPYSMSYDIYNFFLTYLYFFFSDSSFDILPDILISFIFKFTIILVYQDHDVFSSGYYLFIIFDPHG